MRTHTPLRTAFTSIAFAVAVSAVTIIPTSVAVSASSSVSISVMTWQPGGPTFWDNTVKSFEAANPNIKVQQVVVPYADYPSKLGEYGAANSGPDVIMITSGNYMQG